jgi:hypothetical protein
MLRVQSILEPGPCDDEETTEEITRENIEQMQQDLWKGNWGRPNPSARKQYFKGHVWGKKKG